MNRILWSQNRCASTINLCYFHFYFQGTSPNFVPQQMQQNDSDKANNAAKANAAFAAQVLANLQKVIIFIFF